MKGLLLKDFYTIWKAGRIFIILYIFIAAVSGMNLQNGWSLSLIHISEPTRH